MGKFKKGFYKGWLTDKSIIELRRDVSLGSVFISDYENRFGISPEQVCTFFDGYNSFIEELIENNNAVRPYPAETGDFDKDWKARRDWEKEYNKVYAEYDNDYNLLEWYGCYEENPFTEFVEEYEYW